MDDSQLLAQLEQIHVAKKQSKTAMAKLLGCKSPQQYTNWLRRESIPKDYHRRVVELIGSKAQAQTTESSSAESRDIRSAKALASTILELESIEQAHRVARLVLEL